MIDDGGNARLTGFNLVTVALDQSVASPPQRAEGTIPWMSPELLYPEKFDLDNSHPTMASDCYALGMVIYEVLSGHAPFATFRDPEIVFSVLGGQRPERPKGDEGKLFTDGIWEVLELCWKQRPSERLDAGGILMGLGGNLSLSRKPSDMDEDIEVDVDDDLVVAPGMFSLSSGRSSIQSSSR